MHERTHTVSLESISLHSAFGPRFSGDLYSDTGNVATLRTTDISADGRIAYDDMPRAEIEEDRFQRHFLQKGDLIITRSGRVGTAAIFEEHDLPVLPGAFLIRFRLNEEIVNPRYYAYFFNSTDGQHLVKSVATGSVQQNLNITNLNRLQVPCPPREVQDEVVSILGSLDDKIEHNRRTAQALERLARAIFKAWFVDFEPVKAKAAGATSFPSMPQDVFDALPTTFVDTEIGPVPEGWGVKALSDTADFLNGLALQKYPPRNDGSDLPVIKIAQLRKGSTDGASLANEDVPEKYVIRDRDLIFSWSGTLEAEIWYGGTGALNQHLFKVTSDTYPQWLVFHWIRDQLPWFRTIAASKATTMGHIKRSHLKEAKVAVPPEDALGSANGLLGPLYDLHAQTNFESRHLAMIRDYLLPRLVSGRCDTVDYLRTMNAS